MPMDLITIDRTRLLATSSVKAHFSRFNRAPQVAAGDGPRKTQRDQ
jgi:hypothetical protein